MKYEEFLKQRQIIDNKLDFFYELISCNSPLKHFTYAGDGHLLKSNADNERILDHIFTISGIKAYMLEYAKSNTMPLILGSSLGNVWAAVLEPGESGEFRYHVLGPAFLDVVSSANLLKRVNTYDNIPLNWKNSFLRLVQQFPAVPSHFFHEYVLMLHYIVTGQKIKTSDFTYQNDIAFSTDRNTSESIEEYEKENLPWRAQEALLHNVREGNLNFQAALENGANVSTGVNIDIGDSLKKTQVSSCIFTALCAYTAIEAGLSAERAYTLQNLYLQNILTSNTITELAAINHKMYEDFIQRVHAIKKFPHISQQVQSCMDYIEIHAAEDLPLSMLARQIGYTEYYLSRKFKKETGKSINCYIKEQKLTLAKKLLTTTDSSIQDISEQLHFCSRSYFTDVFCRQFNISPADYRKLHRKF